MRKYKCIVVDDEPIARKIVIGYLNQLPYLELAGEYKTAVEALAELNLSKQIDLVFLDINLPHLSGTALVRALVHKPQIIFTTAYSEYAVESYELDAADYLLKPFLFERFVKAVTKAIGRMPETAEKAEAEVIGRPLWYLKSEGEVYQVNVQDVLYCEAAKNYTRIVMHNGQVYKPLAPISKIEEELNHNTTDFMRVHRSFLVARAHIKSVAAQYVTVADARVPIGEQYKAEVLAALGWKK